MTAKILTLREQWALIPEGPNSPLIAVLREGRDEVVIIEHEGRIVASWPIVETLTLHGCQIEPEVTGQASVIFKGLAAMKARVRERGFRSATTSVDTPYLHGICRAIGGNLIPGETFIIPVED